MSSPTTPSRRSAEMPMPGGKQQERLLDALERPSLYELCLELPKLAESLSQDPIMKANGFGVVETVKAFREEPKNGWKMCELLHGMRVPVIKSVIQGTVAYDSINHNTKFVSSTFSQADRVPGVYAVGLSRQGKDGRFVNAEEMRQLIQGIKDYIIGYRARVKHVQDAAAKVATLGNYSSMTTQELAGIRWVRKVDGEAWNQKPCAMYITKDEEVPSIEALVRTYEGMCDPNLSQDEQKTRMIQTPLYIGCSSDLRVRMARYTKDNKLKGMNKPLALTKAILDANGHTSEVRLEVVLRTWKRDQLAMAEQLVCTLAGSLVYQHGFNAIETGGTGPNTVQSDDTLAKARNLIMVGSCEFHDNVRSTREEIEKRLKFSADLDQVAEDIEDLEAEVESMTAMMGDVPDADEWADMEQRLVTRVNQLQSYIEQQRDAKRQWKLLLDVKAALCGLDEDEHGNNSTIESGVDPESPPRDVSSDEPLEGTPSQDNATPTADLVSPNGGSGDPSSSQKSERSEQRASLSHIYSMPSSSP